MKKSLVALMAMVAFLFFGTGTLFAAEKYNQNEIFKSPKHLSEVIGSDVVNHRGQDLGSVHDLVANEEGKLEYLILSKGAALSGTQLVAIPLDAVSPRMTGENEMTINVDKETIERAPAFAAGAYPDYTDRRWQQESRGYFETERTPPTSPQTETNPWEERPTQGVDGTPPTSPQTGTNPWKETPPRDNRAVPRGN